MWQQKFLGKRTIHLAYETSRPVARICAKASRQRLSRRGALGTSGKKLDRRTEIPPTEAPQPAKAFRTQSARGGISATEEP